jgi:uncharacterized protein (TIGR02646 family)
MRSTLLELFQAKCAYCESAIGYSGPAEIDHFRPHRAAVGLDGVTDRPGYWWLAFSWENLYPTCSVCNRNKRDRFPVGGVRARDPAASLRAERAILLDPCHDHPAEHLLFDELGYVASRSSPVGGIDRGAVTIDVLGLNRAGLVQERRMMAESIRENVSNATTAIARGSHNVSDLIAATVDTKRPYLALQRQIAGDLIVQMIGGVSSDVRSRQQAQRSEIFTWQQAHEEDLRRTSVEENPDREWRQSQTIEAIEVVNFRGIERLELRFGTGTVEHAGWAMLLGENGVGKSSLLQALAIALMGAERVHRLGADAQPSDLLRRGAECGRIRVFFAADPEPLEVRLTSTSVDFAPTAAKPRMIVLGFGASRWLPRAGGFEPDGDEFVRTRNLFNPFVPLADTLAWLASIDEQQFARVEEAMLRLLALDAGGRLLRVDGDVLVERTRSQPAVSLRQLSDGYQAIIAMAGDIMDLLGSKRIDSATAEGVVLVDEIGSHLHPRWKMQVVSRLRATFPRLQFLASTHDPLCLRGLHDGEICLLRCDSSGRVVRIDELPSVESLHVDQLLTSSYFGLHSTVDPEIEDQFDEYYDLLARARRTRQQEGRLDVLQRDLDTRELLGSTRREREMLTAIDTHLAREADALAEGKDELLKQETGELLAEILRRVDRET